MAPEPTRHFIEVDGRQVHYARAGTGPAVALLHGSPQSHRALLPLMRRLAPRFTVFAFDTPGYGASDPVPGHPQTLAPFADALVASVAALRLGPIPIYGTHTGAGIALEAANRHPAAVTRAVLDGFGIWTGQEQEDMLREYLPAYPPAWDGSHLAALWSRVRDAAEFFPFFRRGTSARRARTPTLAAVHQAAMDMLHAGPGYRIAYAASIRHDPAALEVDPARIRLVCRTDDMLLGHLDRLPPGFPRANAQAVDDASWAPTIERLLAEAACTGATPTEAPAAPATQARSYAGPPGAQVHIRRMGEGPGRPLVLLHANPGSSGSMVVLAEALAQPLARSLPNRPILLPDCPGSGLSDPAATPAEAAARIAAALPPEADRAGVGSGGALASLIRTPGRVALIDPPPANDPAWLAAQPFDTPPDWNGGHLLAAWYRHRDALLHTPWFDRRRETQRDLPPAIDLDDLHARTIETLDEARPVQGGEGLCRALLAIQLRADARFHAGPGATVQSLAAQLTHWQGT